LFNNLLSISKAKTSNDESHPCWCCIWWDLG